MTKSQRLNSRLGKLQLLDRAGRRELSESESCTVKLETPHERLMWGAGFRKGLSQALQGDRSFKRAEERSSRSRGSLGDKTWCRGFNAGVNYVPVYSHSPKMEEPACETPSTFSKAENRRLRHGGRL